MHSATRNMLLAWGLAILFTIGIIGAVMAQTQPQYVAIDGDTIAVNGERIRIIGLDTPETYGAQCDEELRAGFMAQGRLQHYLTTRRVRIERKGLDKYRRTLARVWVGNDEVPSLMIAGGYARANFGEKRQPWCPKGSARPGYN